MCTFRTTGCNLRGIAYRNSFLSLFFLSLLYRASTTAKMPVPKHLFDKVDKMDFFQLKYTVITANIKV